MSLSTDVRDAVQRDLWVLAEGELSGKPIVVRFRPELRKVQDVSGYPYLIVINWTYPADENGMPTDAALDEVDDFEDILLTALESDCHTVLAAVITNDGQRQWALYSSNVEETGDRVNSMPHQAKRYPIEILTDDDPEWVYLKENLLGDCPDHQPQSA